MYAAIVEGRDLAVGGPPKDDRFAGDNLSLDLAGDKFLGKADGVPGIPHEVIRRHRFLPTAPGKEGARIRGNNRNREARVRQC